jgi:hypothetical protein
MSMTMLVQDMYDGVKAMIKKEIELGGGAPKPKAAAAPAEAPAAAAGPVKCGPHLKDPS